MGKVIKKKIQGMNWLMKTGLVLLLTIATSVFMYEGWYKPKPAQAAVAPGTAWSNINATAPGNQNATVTSTGTYTAGAGTNRILVVAISCEIASAVQAMTTLTATYGGTALTQLASTHTSANRSHQWVGYLKDAQIPAGAQSVAVTYDTGNATNNLASLSINVGTYTGVNQTTPFNASNANFSAATTVTTNGAIAYLANGLTFIASTNGGTPVTQTITPAATFTNRLSNGTNQQTFIDDVAHAAGGTYASGAISITYAGTTSTRSALVVGTFNPAPTDVTAPTVATPLAVNPDIATTYTSSTPTLTAVFTEAESTLTSCDYDAGAGWVGGVVSGSSPTWTCTATLPTLTAGAKTFQMRAISTGGTSAATTLTRTVDLTVPTDGVLTVTAGNTQNSLSWTAATDVGGSGIASYILRFATGATPPASCAVGTAVPGSPFSSATLATTHTGLTNGTQYSYRLCATDNTGNTSGGATGSATPAPITTAITRCDGCHGYSAAIGAGATFTDAPTTRNSPDGDFRGSHNKHVIGQVYVCSTCHRVPATETSTDFGHSKGTIRLKPSPLLAGGTYNNISSKIIINSPVFSTCTNTTCHVSPYSASSIASPTWGTPSGCNACHYAAADTNNRGAFVASFNGPSTGGHSLHMKGNGIVCGNCHFGAVAGSSGGALHANTFVNLTTGYTSPTRNKAAKHASGAAGSGYYTCNNSGCHANPYAAGSLTTATWGTGTGGCVACHLGSGAFISYSAPTAGNSATPQQSGPNTGSHSGHVNYGKYICRDCHAGALTGVTGGNKHGNGFINVTGASGAYVPAGIAKHAIGTYSATGCSAACHMGVGGTANPIWGSLVLGCIDCHKAQITRTKGRPGTKLAAVTTEFGLVAGHKASGKTPVRAAVADLDCIVCHLEGNGTTHKTSKYHADGNIDLRDPDALATDGNKGETPITNLTGGTFTFQRFSTSYAAGSRSATGATNNADIAQVISVKFCVACHDANGAQNTTAYTTGGTNAMPFGGVALGATYTAANNAVGTQGLIDVATQFAITNSTRHPVLGSRTKDFPYSNRLAAPYNNIGTARDSNGTTTHTTAASVVINCFDCHNTSGTPLTLRTVAAHGNNQVPAAGYVTLRGTIYATTPTLCTTCHITYTSTGNHGTGSAWAATGSSHNVSQNCHYCHGSNATTAAPARPVRAQDYHGSNARVGGGLWPTINARPVAFIRGWAGTAYHRGYSLAGTSGYVAGTAGCTNGATGNNCPDGQQIGAQTATRTYTAGGSY